ncbi:MAG: enoyl-CoA hydratase/isomerase family protein [Candidatus Binataceae bacterium]|nr:enoyl-CoA hydratase/isomerase family protein [Candidatus Binataceae bacterium]
MATYETVSFEKVEEKIFRLTLNRPEKLNALSPQLLAEFDQVLDAFEADREASVLIIRGAGRAFCAGYDLQGTQQPGSRFTVSSDRVNLQKLVERWQRLWAIGKPTIAQVHGYCLAGATELAGHCDLVFASEDAQFGHPAGRTLGILPTLSMWPILMGPRKSKEFFFTGDLMSAAEALEAHLVNRVYPRDRLDTETLAYARRVALVPVELLALHKAAVNRWLEVQGIRALEQSAADLDCIAHQTDTVKNWMQASRERGLKEALSERDRPFAVKQ